MFRVTVYGFRVIAVRGYAEVYRVQGIRFPKMWGFLWGGPQSKDSSIFGSMLGSPYVWKSNRSILGSPYIPIIYTIILGWGSSGLYLRNTGIYPLYNVFPSSLLRTSKFCFPDFSTIEFSDAGIYGEGPQVGRGLLSLWILRIQVPDARIFPEN